MIEEEVCIDHPSHRFNSRSYTPAHGLTNCWPILTTHTHTLSSPSRFVPMRPDRRCTFLHVLMDGLKVAGHRTTTKVEGPELDFPSWVPQVTKGVRCTVTGYLSPWPPCKTWRSRSSSPGPWSQRRVVQQTGVPHFHRVLSSLNMEMENG